MLETSARLLRLLSLLQTRREWTGAELAGRLDVTTRTLRRDVDRLRELGYPVNARIGVGGGYQLGAGAEMPPLLLDDEEAPAVAFGLQSTAVGPVAGIGEASLRALTKLRQVMPSRLQNRLDALQVDIMDRPQAASAVGAQVLAAVASVCHARERLRFDYTARNGTHTRREVEPHRVVQADSRWYLVAWDVQREDWRSFRVDRMTLKSPTGPRFTPRHLPEGGAAAFVAQGFKRAFTKTRARVRLHAPIDQVAGRVPEGWGTVECDEAETCVVSLRGEELRDIAQWLAVFEVPFTVLDPPELRDACREFAQRHAELAARYRTC
ncbi:YafY family protein [Streptomyces sp. NPDC005811]|uniref:helix-turn-helix transcriptional regulator n=1 Tax=Streptomyces sp. NPDC005811 TaxID=3154565 RepID=UPI0033CBAC9B